MTAIFIGLALALVVSLFGTVAGFDRERGFYPLILIVSASYYDLFAAMGGAHLALLLESMVLAAFVAAAWWGFRNNPRIVAIALVCHGIFDLAHARLIANPDAPVWWPLFCLGYDLAAALYLSLILRRVPTATQALALRR